MLPEPPTFADVLAARRRIAPYLQPTALNRYPALDELVTLHHARAHMEGKPWHPDYFVSPEHLAFLRDVVVRMADHGALTIARLVIQDTTIASMCVLRANEGVFFSFSGLDPTWWRLGAMTTLQAACLR